MSNASFWDKTALKYAKDPISDMEAYALTRDRIIEILQPHHKVLELGCGTGSTALELADRVDSYIGTEVSPNMIAIARGKLGGHMPENLSFEIQDVAAVASDSYDVVIALNLLHLVPDLEIILGRIYSTLPSGGLLIAKTGLLKDGLWVLPWVIPVMRLIGKAPFVRSLGEVELLVMLKNAGFLVAEKLTQDGMVPRMFTVAIKP